MAGDDVYLVDLAVRFRDIDAMGHVNNAVYATYLEHARARYFRDVVGASLVDADTVLAHLSLDYRAPIDLEDETVTVALTVPRLGTSSIPMEYELLVGDEVAATAESVQVVFDRETGTSRPIPEDWRAAIEADQGL